MKHTITLYVTLALGILSYHTTHAGIADFSKKIDGGISQLEGNKKDMLNLKTGITTAQSSIAGYTKDIQNYLNQEKQQMATVNDLSQKVNSFLNDFSGMGASFKKKVDDVPVVGAIAHFLHVDDVAESLGNDINNFVSGYVKPVQNTLGGAHTALASIDTLLTGGLTSITLINAHLTKVNSLLDQITQEQDNALQAMNSVSKYMADMAKAK